MSLKSQHTKTLKFGIEVSTHGLKMSTHENRDQNWEMDDQVSTHRIKMSTHEDSEQNFKNE